MSAHRQDGDAAAAWTEEFAAICDSHRGRLVRWLTAIFGSRDAEDIAQEALVRLYVRPGLLDDDADAWPWLSVVARNVGRDMLRHSAFTTTVDSATLDQLPDDRRVHDEVVARDDAHRLAYAWQRISARDRELLRLREVDGVGVGEIADRLGLNDNAVRQQLFRARRRLASAFVELGGDRRRGFLPVLWLRVREGARKYGRFCETLVPGASTAVAAAVPVVVAGLVTGAVLLATTSSPERRAAGGVPAIPERRVPPPPYPLAAATPSPPAAAPGRARITPSPTPPPPVEVDETIGPVAARGYTRRPLSGPGYNQRWEVTVDVPVVGEYSIVIWEYSTGHGPVCRRLGCPTGWPTPPPTPPPRR